MKNILILGCLFIANVAFGQTFFTNSIPTAHATIITNRATFLNNNLGTSITASNLVMKYGYRDLTNSQTWHVIRAKEAERVKNMLFTNYVNATQNTKNTVTNALGFTP